MQAPIGEEERQLWNYDLGLRWEGHWGFQKAKKATLQILVAESTAGRLGNVPLGEFFFNSLVRCS